jgi:surface protein
MVQFSDDSADCLVLRSLIVPFARFCQFEGAYMFNQDLSSWDVTTVTNMYQMFSDAQAFNYSLCKWGSKIKANVNRTGLFNSSGCPVTSDPVSNGVNFAAGPFCHVC